MTPHREWVAALHERHGSAKNEPNQSIALPTYRAPNNPRPPPAPATPAGKAKMPNMAKKRPLRGSITPVLARSLALAAIALWLPGTAQARGQMYRYLDDRGVIHFSNVPRDDRYRVVSLAPRGLHHARRREPPPETRFDSIILTAARQQAVEPALVKAVIAAESNFDPYAVSKKGAQGLMQLMPQTAEALGVRDVFEPRENVGGGTRYLRLMLDRYGDVSRALAAYNAGPTAVDRYRGIPPYRETRDYVARVLTYYRGYHDQIGARSGSKSRSELASEFGSELGSEIGSELGSEIGSELGSKFGSR